MDGERFLQIEYYPFLEVPNPIRQFLDVWVAENKPKPKGLDRWIKNGN